ncbi:FKBP-type peptidyl-prolyl cis-trans isomerase [Novosphingobium sp. FGD1]|jgi:FKBP-type peptidyl-prolyl cis-trans isomerase FkpA|uniref:Peptidyl-prolyl cis-trans isomerase n=1 Tax=Novosphingobium silvae TaxID=2692619 RepID=A0A7X4K6M8_9SPHN|nr:FKBP-type peptidyl-prolyl cis-trans isomerase [Novosphingobium silvae]MYL97330.1 FKBP-type peptidyl-prolyl cis-trans isomerase [Novosphingobium silvae]
MTEITRVPLQPIAKGAVTKLWLGVAAVALAAGGVAYAALPPTPSVKTLTAGTGDSPTMEDVVLINYKGMLMDGTVFDENKSYPNPVAQFVPGFSKALMKMQRGGKYEIVIPSELAYGATPPAGSPIPADADLKFEVELLDYKSLAEIQQQQRIMQQLQQMQQQGAVPGAPGAPGAGPAPVQP